MHASRAWLQGYSAAISHIVSPHSLPFRQHTILFERLFVAMSNTAESKAQRRKPPQRATHTKGEIAEHFELEGCDPILMQELERTARAHIFATNHSTDSMLLFLGSC